MRNRLGTVSLAFAFIAAVLAGFHFYWMRAVEKAAAGGDAAAALAADLLIYVDGAGVLAALLSIGFLIAKNRASPKA